MILSLKLDVMIVPWMRCWKVCVLVKSGRAIATLESPGTGENASEPVLKLINEVLVDKKQPIPTQLVFGMELLLSSYKTFIRPDGVLNDTNCRISALKFAQEVSKSVGAAMASLEHVIHSHSDSLAMQSLVLNVFQNEINSYQQEKRFDLYHQAPWVATSHMIEILHHSMDLGGQLCCQYGFVGAVLHLYNALRVCRTEMPKIAIFERLCSLFLQPLLLGSRPDKNFSSCFRKALGGKLEKTWENGTRPSFALSKPKPAMTHTRNDPGRKTLFYSLHNNYYGPTEDMWIQVCAGKSAVATITQDRKHEILSELNSVPFNVTVDRMKDAILPEFAGEFPVTRVKYFDVLALCIRVLVSFASKFSMI